MSRQEAEKVEKRKAKTCPSCGCRLWLHDTMTGGFQGPYHFQECAEVPGGAELAKERAIERLRWIDEPYVPKPQGQRVLQAILLMMKARSDREMQETKAAIQAELKTLEWTGRE